MITNPFNRTKNMTYKWPYCFNFQASLHFYWYIVFIPFSMDDNSFLDLFITRQPNLVIGGGRKIQLPNNTSIVEKCLKFLISIDSLLLWIFFIFIYYYNIIFLYGIMKIIRNNFINILDYEEKKLWDGNELVKTIKVNTNVRKNRRHLVEWRNLWCRYKEWEIWMF